MDSEIMGLINTEVAKLPQRQRKQKDKQYEAGKQKLSAMFPNIEPLEHEYMRKAIAKKYGV